MGVTNKLFPLRKVRAEASASFNDCQRLLSSDFWQPQELKLNDDPTISINLLAQSPGALQTVLNMGVKISENAKVVLDRLGRARTFLETVMKFGTGASQANPIATAMFACVNTVYKVLEDEERYNQLVLDLAKDMAYTLGYIEDVEQFARLGQLQQAIKEVQPFVEGTTNFIVEFTSDGEALRLPLSSRTQAKIDELTSAKYFWYLTPLTPC